MRVSKQASIAPAANHPQKEYDIVWPAVARF